jgi:putative flippase GtrA
VFLIFGGTAALTTLSTGWVLYGTGLFPGLPYWCATGAAAFAGLVVNFSLNHFLNFRFRERSAFQQFSTFFVVSGVGALLSSCLSVALLHLFEFCFGNSLPPGGIIVPSKLAAHVGAVALVALYSFPAHKFLSFNIGIGARLRQLKVLIRLVKITDPRFGKISG